jgi:EpsI family protein
MAIAMREKNKQLVNLAIIFFILLLTIVIVTWFDQKRSHAIAGFELNRVGMKIGDWAGSDMKASERDRKWVEQGDLVVRTYYQEEDIIYLVAIQERGDRHRVHSPADCYTGAGWVVLGKESVKLRDGDGKSVRRMRVVKADTSRLVYYWFTNGIDQCASFRGHLLLFLKDVLLKGSVRSWACFQVSADINGDIVATDEMIGEFIFNIEESIKGI